MRSEIEERVQLVMNQASEYAMKFETYSFLWEDNRSDYLKQFLKYGRQLTPEEVESKSAGEEIPDAAPTLDQFREVVSSYEIRDATNTIDLYNSCCMEIDRLTDLKTFIWK